MGKPVNVQKGKQGFQPSTGGKDSVPTPSDTPRQAGAPSEAPAPGRDYAEMHAVLDMLANTPVSEVDPDSPLGAAVAAYQAREHEMTHCSECGQFTGDGAHTCPYSPEVQSEFHAAVSGFEAELESASPAVRAALERALGAVIAVSRDYLGMDPQGISESGDMTLGAGAGGGSVGSVSVGALSGRGVGTERPHSGSPMHQGIEVNFERLHREGGDEAFEAACRVLRNVPLPWEGRLVTDDEDALVRGRPGSLRSLRFRDSRNVSDGVFLTSQVRSVSSDDSTVAVEEIYLPGGEEYGWDEFPIALADNPWAPSSSFRFIPFEVEKAGRDDPSWGA